jgi:DNA ligase-1
MPDIADGASVEMQGSGSKPYVLKNTGGVYSCTCPAWRNQSIAIEQRTCKHLRKLRGEAAEAERCGSALPQKPAQTDDEADASAPPLLLAESWDNAADLSGWWMSEKLDGVRAYWDGQQFLSRQGNLYHAPDWFVEQLPATPLDGELWIDRKKFQRTVSIVRRQDKSELWREVKFLVFDAPAQSGGFEERLGYVKDALQAARCSFATPHDHALCKSLDHLRGELTRVEALGGEGLMLRAPGSSYAAGRSANLLKVKTFHDAEATIVGHQGGAGRHKGRLGALLVQLADGTNFAVGTGFSDAQREAPPPIGATITFRYQELSEGGVPRFPSYVGVRTGAKATSTLPAAEPKAKQTKKTTVALAPISAAAPSDSPQRYFEFTDAKSSKFWEVSRSGSDMTTRWGRIGAAGQSKTKTFADPAAAAKQVEKLITEKTDEGYVEKPS